MIYTANRSAVGMAQTGLSPTAGGLAAHAPLGGAHLVRLMLTDRLIAIWTSLALKWHDYCFLN